jgi:hypothetical protein
LQVIEATHLSAPMSRIGILTQKEIEQTVASSLISSKYNEVIDKESAFEILNKKLREPSEKKQTSEKNRKAKKNQL